MIAIVRDGNTGRFFRVLLDPNTNRVVRILGPALLSDISPGFNEPGELATTLPAAELVGFLGPGAMPGGEAALRQPKLDQPIPFPTFRPLAGAQQNNRGFSRQVNLTTGGFLNTPETQIVESVVAAPRSSGDDAESILVTLGMTYEREDRCAFVGDLTQRQRVVEATALLQWGVGGASFTAECDWQQGTVIALPASFVNVGLRFFSPGSGDVLFPPLTATFSASLAYGYGGAPSLGSTARKTIFVPEGLGVSGSPTGSFTQAIPRWATSFTLVGSQGLTIAPNVGLLVTADAVGAFTVGSYLYTNRTNLAQQFETTYPIANSGRFLTVTNLDEDNRWSNIGVLYHLAFP